MLFILIKTIHLLFVLILFGCLCVEFFTLKEKLSRQDIKRIALVDALYGLASIVVLASGLYIALKLGKGAVFYFDNLAIYIKLGIFIVVGLLSIKPTIFFIKQGKGNAEEIISIPSIINKLIVLELLLLLSIPFFGVLLANNMQLF